MCIRDSLEEEGVDGHEDKSSAKDDINLVTPEELKAFLDDYVCLLYTSPG